eukprot:TRINITY_DN188_c0_g1_i13.p1 TRINITY_DN188_c0_g1~~TRINITY_DN188_c0_g1_i13.p1  ORF type:complete len:112 (+),score=35.78 TRINITY_DN188_c0_g1_i13:23-337(+)
MIRRPPRSTHCISSAASDVYKRQPIYSVTNFPEFMGGFFDEIGEEGDFLILSLCKQGDYWEEVVLYLEIYYYHLTLRYPDPAMATHSAIAVSYTHLTLPTKRIV